VYDVTDQESFDNVRFWMSEVDANSPEVQRILIGNKADLERKVSKEEANALAHELGIDFWETSAKRGQNVESAFLAMLSV
jgi:GTPase SAR1 family protein